MESMTTLEFHAIRNSCGLSTKQLGRILGVGDRTVRSWEQGRMLIRDRVADAMRVLAVEHFELIKVFREKAKMGEPVVLEFDRGFYDGLERPREWYVTALGVALAQADLCAEWVGEPSSHKLDERWYKPVD